MGFDDLHIFQIPADLSSLFPHVPAHDVENIRNAEGSTLSEVLINIQDEQDANGASQNRSYSSQEDTPPLGKLGKIRRNLYRDSTVHHQAMSRNIGHTDRCHFSIVY